jgi:hypothetical protein
MNMVWNIHQRASVGRRKIHKYNVENTNNGTGCGTVVRI